MCPSAVSWSLWRREVVLYIHVDLTVCVDSPSQLEPLGATRILEPPFHFRWIEANSLYPKGNSIGDSRAKMRRWQLGLIKHRVPHKCKGRLGAASRQATAPLVNPQTVCGRMISAHIHRRYLNGGPGDTIGDVEFFRGGWARRAPISQKTLDVFARGA